jgi:sigma-B regulation protein RsbU (phosphoserine phosphatase)
VPEARNPEDQLLGADRMLEILNEDPDAEPSVIIGNMKAGMANFVREAEPFDDTTMLCLKYFGPAGTKSIK